MIEPRLYKNNHWMTLTILPFLCGSEIKIAANAGLYFYLDNSVELSINSNSFNKELYRKINRSFFLETTHKNDQFI